MEELGAGGRRKGIQALPKPLIELIRTHGFGAYSQGAAWEPSSTSVGGLLGTAWTAVFENLSLSASVNRCVRGERARSDDSMAVSNAGRPGGWKRPIEGSPAPREIA